MCRGDRGEGGQRKRGGQSKRGEEEGREWMRKWVIETREEREWCERRKRDRTPNTPHIDGEFIC